MSVAHFVPPKPFELRGDHLTVELPGARVVFTTRRGGHSRGPYSTLNLGLKTEDSRDAVIANRSALAEELGLRLTFVRQVHGRRVMTVPAEGDRAGELPDGDRAGVLPEADGQATSTPGIGLTMLAADCLPVAVASGGAVAMVHAGWRGLAGGVIEEGVRVVRELGGRGPLHAAIGPGAGPCCYEVGEGVHAVFERRFPGSSRGRNLDLKAIARAQLLEAGAVVVHDSGLCTICSEPSLFFSHRRDRGVTGRQAGIIWLEPVAPDADA